MALGYFVLSAVRRGPLATAGTVAAALGVPAFMFFVTFDENGLPPYNTEAILIVSTVVWLGTYSVGPAKGRPFFLGSGLIGCGSPCSSSPRTSSNPRSSGAAFFGAFYVEDAFESSGTAIDPETGEIIDTGDLGPTGIDEPAFDTPDPVTIGLLSLALGRRLPARRPRARPARPPRHRHAVHVRGDPVPGGRASSASPTTSRRPGSGLLLAVIGLALAYNGATIWRRATTWIGGAAMALGLALFLGDMAGDSATTGGMLFIAGGIAMVFLGHLLASALDEPDELAVTTATREDAPAPRVLVAEPAAGGRSRRRVEASDPCAPRRAATRRPPPEEKVPASHHLHRRPDSDATCGEVHRFWCGSPAGPRMLQRKLSRGAGPRSLGRRRRGRRAGVRGRGRRSRCRGRRW